MKKKEREKINPKLCAEGLHRFLINYYQMLELKEKAVFFGAITLLYDCGSDEWLSKSTEEYRGTNPRNEME